MVGNGKHSEAALVVGGIMVALGILLLVQRGAPEVWAGMSAALQMVANVAWPVCIIAAGVILIYAARKGTLTSQRGSRVYRSRDNRRLGGVCGGIAEHFSMNAVFVRILAVVLFVMSIGLVGLLYLILWASLPDDPTQA